MSNTEMRLEDAMRLLNITNIKDITPDILKEVKRVAQRKHPDFMIGQMSHQNAATEFQKYQRAYGVLEREVEYFKTRSRIHEEAEAPVVHMDYEPVPLSFFEEAHRAPIEELYATEKSRKTANERLNDIFEQQQKSAEDEDSKWRIKNFWAINKAPESVASSTSADGKYNPGVSIQKIEGLTAGNINQKMEELRKKQSQHVMVRREQPLALHELWDQSLVAFGNNKHYDTKEETGIVNYRRCNPLSSGLQFQDVRRAYGEQPIMKTVEEDNMSTEERLAKLEQERKIFLAPISKEEGLRQIAERDALREQQFQESMRETNYNTRRQLEQTKNAMGAFLRLT